MRAQLIFTFFAVTACATAHQPPAGKQAPAPLAGDTLRAMTFNIRYGTAPDGANAWPLRRALTLRAIADFRPEVLGVQEALRFQLDEIRQALPRYGEIGVGRDDGEQKGEYSAILYDRERLEALEHGTFWLSDTPHAPGSMTWGNRYPRIVTWARFRDRAAARSFYVFNTHWDHESQPARERSAALILERIGTRAAMSDPVLLMGDFNAGEDNPAFLALLAANGTIRFHDTFRAVHPDAREVGTFHAFRGGRNGARIDAILASPAWRTVGADIVFLSEQGVYPSDHYPVTARLLPKAIDKPAAPAKPPPQPDWVFSGQITSVWTGGNSESNTFGLASTLRRIGRRGELKLQNGGIRTESARKSRRAVGNSTTFRIDENEDWRKTAETYYGRLRYDRKIDKDALAFIGVDVLRNTFAGIDSRVLVAAGAGTIWVDDERFRFKTDYGATYTFQQDVVNNPFTRTNFPGARVSWDLRRVLTATTRLESALVSDVNFSDTDDIRLDFTNSVAVSVSKALSMKPSLQLLWRNQPALTQMPLFAPDGASTGEKVTVPLEKLDTQFTLALVVTL